MNRLNGQERIGTGLAAGSMLVVGGAWPRPACSAAMPCWVARASVPGGWASPGRLGAAAAHALPHPAGREWAWLAGLAVIGLAGCSVLLILAARVANPASVGVVVGAAPLVIVVAAAAAAAVAPPAGPWLAAAMVTAGSAGAQFGGTTGGTAWSGPGLLLAPGARWRRGRVPAGRPVLPRLGALRRHDLGLRPGRRPAAGRRRRGQLRGQATDPARPPRPSWPRCPTSRSRSPPSWSSPGTRP